MVGGIIHRIAQIGKNAETRSGGKLSGSGDKSQRAQTIGPDADGRESEREDGGTESRGVQVVDIGPGKPVERAEGDTGGRVVGGRDDGGILNPKGNLGHRYITNGRGGDRQDPSAKLRFHFGHIFFSFSGSG